MKNKFIIGLTILSLLMPEAVPLAKAQMPADIKTRLEDLRKEKNALKEQRTAEKEAKSQIKAEESKKKVEEVRKRVLLKLVDLQIKHFQKTAERISRMPNIAGNLKTQLANAIEQAVKDFQTFKTKIESATTREDLQALAKEIRDNFKKHKDFIAKIVEAIHSSRLNNLITKFEEQIKKIEDKIAEAKTAGKNVNALETKIADIKIKIGEAKNLRDQGNINGSVEKIKEAKEIISEVRNAL